MYSFNVLKVDFCKIKIKSRHINTILSSTDKLFVKSGASDQYGVPLINPLFVHQNPKPWIAESTSSKVGREGDCNLNDSN
jgi:hypothetical protein